MYFIRGVELPPWGTLGEDVMQELLARERREKLTAWELMASAIGSFLGHGSERIQDVVLPLRAAYADEVFQKSYTVANLRAKIIERLAIMQEARKRMETLDDMTVG